MKMKCSASRPSMCGEGGRHKRSSTNGASLCICHRRRRRHRSRAVAIAFGWLIVATAGHASAFRHVQPSEGDDKSRGGALIRSLARVAKRGASKWGEHVSSTKKKKAAASMQKSSSVYISKLHQKIQKAQSRDTVDSPDLTQQLDLVDEGNAPPEHFVQEILAYMLAGAAAGSAFAAATAGAFIGTSVIALGAVATTLFTTEEEEAVLHLMEDEDLVADEDESGAAVISESESCDYNGEEEQQGGGEENNIPTKDKLLARRKLDRFVLKELERCYNGNPQRADVDFAWRYPKDVCLAGESDNDAGVVHGAGGELSKDAHTQTESAEEQEMKLADAIEEVCSSTETCGDILPAVEEEAPKRVEVVWHDEFNSASDVHYYTQTQVARHRKKAQRRRASSKAGMDTARRGDAEQTDGDHWAVLTDAERDGALLLSESFRVASSAFGLVADAVRFTGESAAATAGGAARIAGGAVRVSGWAVGSLGEALEKGGGEGKGSDDGHRLPSPDGTDRTRKRQVAGKSVRLIGDAIEQVADSLLLAGSATERVAFAAAGAAEGTVRIVEEFASSLSEMFRLSGVSSDRDLPQREKNVEEEAADELGVAKEDVGLRPTTDEAMNAEEQDNDTQNALSISSEEHSRDEALAELFRQISTWVELNTNAITADTAGIPSIAPEVLGVLLICFIASILLLSPKKIEQGERIGVGVPREVRGERHNVNDHDTHSTLSGDHSTVKAEPDGRRVEPSTTSSLDIMTGPLIFLFSLPLKLARFVLVLSFRIVLSKKTLLLVIYLLGWAFVARTSQHRNTLIQRKSELVGFRSAIQTIGQSPEPTAESAVWLNAIIYKLWRIRDGGLEPLLSASASATLAETLARPYSKPSAVAHVALKAFTFGSSPPFISRLVVDGVDDDRSAVYLTLDVGMLLQDADLILALTPSSLEYKSLPSTQVSVNSIFVPKATLSVAIQCASVYPYVSHANVSLVDIPDVNLRVDSQGVDFGSLPVVSQWIKTSINATLAQYLQPQYVSIDVSAWLGGGSKIISYFEGS